MYTELTEDIISDLFIDLKKKTQTHLKLIDSKQIYQQERAEPAEALAVP